MARDCRSVDPFSIIAGFFVVKPAITRTLENLIPLVFCAGTQDTTQTIFASLELIRRQVFNAKCCTLESFASATKTQNFRNLTHVQIGSEKTDDFWMAPYLKPTCCLSAIGGT